MNSPGDEPQHQHEYGVEDGGDLPLLLESDVLANILTYGMDVEGGFVFGGGLPMRDAPILDTQRVVLQERVVGGQSASSASSGSSGSSSASDSADAAVVNDGDPATLPRYFNAQARLGAGADDAAAAAVARYRRGTICVCGPDLVFSAGVDLFFLDDADLTASPVRFAKLSKTVLQVCARIDGGRVLARSFDEVCVFVRDTDGVDGYRQTARVHPQLLAQSASHTHTGKCNVMDASFGLRRDEILWTLSCGLCLCTSLRSQATLAVHLSSEGLLAFRNIGHSRRFVLLSPTTVTVLDLTVDEPSLRTVVLLRAQEKDRFVAIANHPVHVHLFALASASRTMVLDARIANAPLLSRVHVATSTSDATTLFFCSDGERLLSASVSGVVAQHRLMFTGDVVQWQDNVLLMQTELVDCHTLLTGCCLAEDEQYVYLSSLHGDVLVHRIGTRVADGAEFRRRALWRALQPRVADSRAPYQFGAFGQVVAGVANGIPEQPSFAQCDDAVDAIFKAVQPQINARGQEMLAALKTQWEVE